MNIKLNRIIMTFCKSHIVGMIIVVALILQPVFAASPNANQEPFGRYGESLFIESKVPPSLKFSYPASEITSEATEIVVFNWLGKALFSQDNVDPETVWLESLKTRGEYMGQAENNLDQPTDLSINGTSIPFPRQSRMIAVNLQTGFEYEVSLPTDLLKKVTDRASAAGWDRGYEGLSKLIDKGVKATLDNSLAGEISAAPSVEAASIDWIFADGQDDRTRRFNNTTYPYRAMGQINGGCSGTLVGPRHVLTAAHCLYNFEAQNWVHPDGSGFRFRPGREGTCNDASCQPYGAHQAVWFYTPSEYRETGYGKYDWGIVVLASRPGDQTGWMGYVKATQDWLNNTCDKVPFGPGYLGGACYNRGYPVCSFEENEPLSNYNCHPGWAYQDVNPCEIGSFAHGGPDGWYSIFKTNCDIGKGHSGSAVWTDQYDGHHYAILGVTVYQCGSDCGGSDNYPNGIRRITPDVVSWINFFKSTSPYN